MPYTGKMAPLCWIGPLASLLLTWIDFNPNMNKLSHPLQSAGWNNLSIPNFNSAAGPEIRHMFLIARRAANVKNCWPLLKSWSPSDKNCKKVTKNYRQPGSDIWDSCSPSPFLIALAFSLVRFCGIHLRAISLWVPKTLSCVMNLKRFKVIASSLRSQSINPNPVGLCYTLI